MHFLFVFSMFNHILRFVRVFTLTHCKRNRVEKSITMLVLRPPIIHLKSYLSEKYFNWISSYLCSIACRRVSATSHFSLGLCRMWWWVPWLVLAGVACAQDWRCPHISDVSCSCDFPHTLRCTGGPAALETIADALRALAPSASVSLLDCSLQNLSFLPGSLLQVGYSS